MDEDEAFWAPLTGLPSRESLLAALDESRDRRKLHDRVDRLEADVDLLREIVDAVAQGEHGPQLERHARQALDQTEPKTA